MSEQDDLKEMARNLINAEPAAAIARGAAKIGQMASDAKDAIVAEGKREYAKFRPMLPGQTAPAKGKK
jgi:hypothetical protein